MKPSALVKEPMQQICMLLAPKDWAVPTNFDRCAASQKMFQILAAHPSSFKLQRAAAPVPRIDKSCHRCRADEPPSTRLNFVAIF